MTMRTASRAKPAPAPENTVPTDGDERCPGADFVRPGSLGGRPEIDWEVFFENRECGLIPLIMGAQSFDKLRKCSDVVVENLFARDDDAAKREAFGRIVNNFLDSHHADVARAPDQVLPEVKDGLAKILRYIKDDRLARAEAYAHELEDRMEDAEAAFPKERREPPGLIAVEPETPDGTVPAPEPVPEHDVTEAEHEDARKIFITVFWEVIRERLDTLQSGLGRPLPVQGPTPFMFSPEFTQHFGAVLTKHVIPEVANRTNSLIHQAELRKPEERRDYLRQALDDQRNRKVVWETWKATWKELTAEQPLPRKPSGKKKSAAAKLLGKFKDDTPSWKNQMSEEEWREETRRIKEANRRAKRLWARIATGSDAYEVPGVDDNDFLMELFGRSPAVIREQVAALRQIATQGGNEGKAFDMYQRGKKLDLTLLTAALRYPDIFLEGNRPIIKVLTAAYPKGSLKTFMPLLARYLGPYLD